MRHAMPHPADSLRGTGTSRVGDAVLFAERLHLHGGIGGVEGEHLIRLFLSHYA